MDHLCYFDNKENEYEKLLDGSKTMLARGSRTPKPPFKHVFSGDNIVFVSKKKRVILQAQVKDVINAEKLNKQQKRKLIFKHNKELNLSERKCRKLLRKNYLVFIELRTITNEEHLLCKKALKNAKDWTSIGSVNTD